jgi:hypothetical protein
MDFTCRYCNRPTTLTNPNQDTSVQKINIIEDRMTYDAKVCLRYIAVACPNPNCRKLTLQLTLSKYEWNGGEWSDTDDLESWRLLPESSAKPQPTYIPKAIIDNYQEACRILDLSPKASAALSRRCIQGMIRDYWKISKRTLNDEIIALEDKVTADVWGAIDSVRSVGNIGAHFEKDVNLIVDIEPGEAELLVRLIEDLFAEWYVSQYDRKERQKKLQDLAAQKAALRKKAIEPSEKGKR